MIGRYDLVCKIADYSLEKSLSLANLQLILWSDSFADGTKFTPTIVGIGVNKMAVKNSARQVIHSHLLGDDYSVTAFDIEKNPRVGIFQIPVQKMYRTEGSGTRKERSVFDGYGFQDDADKLHIFPTMQALKEMILHIVSDPDFVFQDIGVVAKASASVDAKNISFKALVRKVKPVKPGKSGKN